MRKGGMRKEKNLFLIGAWPASQRARRASAGQQGRDGCRPEPVAAAGGGGGRGGGD